MTATDVVSPAEEAAGREVEADMLLGVVEGVLAEVAGQLRRARVGLTKGKTANLVEAREALREVRRLARLLPGYASEAIRRVDERQELLDE